MANKEIREIRKSMENLLVESALAREQYIKIKNNLRNLAQTIVLLRNNVLLMDDNEYKEVFLNVATASLETLKLTNQTNEMTQNLVSNYQRVIEKLIFNQPNTSLDDKQLIGNSKYKL